jgi:16S rRNA (adenine1518-N6/adenine1519-N6)-dimethyltransferase
MTAPVFHPTELHAFLNQIGAKAKKGLSQNFLIDGNILRKIIASAKVGPGDIVIEIGAGPGALTQGLLEKGCHVIAIEKDPVFAAALMRLQTEDNRLEVFSQDFFDFPFAEIVSKKNKKVSVVANLPYHITTPVLIALLPMNESIDTITIMIQKEVAKRLAAKPNTPEYGSITLFLEAFSKVSYEFTVSPRCFFPVPRVESAVVQLKLQKPVCENPADLFVVTRAGFQKRRKMLRASLRHLYPSALIESALLQIGCLNSARAEELSLAQFIKLADILKASGSQQPFESDNTASLQSLAASPLLSQASCI